MKRTTKKLVVAGLALGSIVAPLMSSAPAVVSATDVAPKLITPAPLVPVLNANYIAPVTDNPYVFKARFSVTNPDLTPVRGIQKVEMVILKADGSVERAMDMKYVKLDASKYDAWIDQDFISNQFGKTFYILVTDVNGKQQLVKSGGETSTYNYGLSSGNKVIIHATRDRLLSMTPAIDIATRFNGIIDSGNPKLVKLAFQAGYEYGESMDNIKVTLKSETTGWSITLDPNYTLWRNPANPTQYHVWFDQQLLSYGEKYSVTITGPNGASELLYMPDAGKTTKLSNGKTLTTQKGAFDRLYITVS